MRDEKLNHLNRWLPWLPQPALSNQMQQEPVRRDGEQTPGFIFTHCLHLQSIWEASATDQALPCKVLCKHTTKVSCRAMAL